jgi:hypothetical protein
VEATPDGWSVTAPGAATTVASLPDAAGRGGIGTDDLADIVAAARRR